MRNMQVSQPRSKSLNGELSVHSIFYTIQGEGPFAGRPAIFIRLAGCNLQCPACDTEYTLVDEDCGDMTPSEVLDRLEVIVALGRSPTPLIVLTGGEPFRQRIAPLLNLLLGSGYNVQIETNGSLYDTSIDLGAFSQRSLTVVCSPKTGSVHRQIEATANAYKYVVKHGDIAEDGLPLHALDHPCGPGGVYRPGSMFPRNRIYVQPLDEGDSILNRMHLQTAIDSCKSHGYTFCLQVHKHINLP